MHSSGVEPPSMVPRLVTCMRWILDGQHGSWWRFFANHRRLRDYPDVVGRRCVEMGWRGPSKPDPRYKYILASSVSWGMNVFVLAAESSLANGRISAAVIGCLGLFPPHPARNSNGWQLWRGMFGVWIVIVDREEAPSLCISFEPVFLQLDRYK